MKPIRMALAGLVVLSCWLAHAGTAKPCQASLSACPRKGCAKEAPSALSNIVKHGHKLSGEPRTLSFADFESLQDQLEQRFGGKYATLSKPDRARLRNFQVSSGTVGERDFVEITGYIALKPGKSQPHANTGESVNCNLKGPDNNDFHISLTPKPNDTEFHGIVAEMIPQDREEKWTEKRLQAVQQANLQVRARGQLFLDNHHKANPDENHPMGGQPKRFSLWEIHPVVAFEVCAAESCSADSSSWQPLEEWNPPASGGKKKNP